MGRPWSALSKKIRKLDQAAREYWDGVDKHNSASFDDVWHSSLSECDSASFSIPDLQSVLCSRIKDALNIQGTVGIVDAEIDAIMNGHSRQQIIPDAAPIAPRRTQPPSEPLSEGGDTADSTPVTSIQTAETSKTVVPAISDQPVIPTGLSEVKETPQLLTEAIKGELINVIELGDLEKFIELTKHSVGFSVHLSVFPKIDTSTLPNHKFMQETILAVLAQIRSTALDDPNLLINDDIRTYLFNGHWQQMSYQLYLGHVVTETDENFGDVRLWASIASIKKHVRRWNQSISCDEKEIT